MRIFVLESMIAFWSAARGDGDSAARSLLAEGTAMAAAVASDFQTAGHEVFGIRDPKLNDLPPPLDRFRPFAVMSEPPRFAEFLHDADYLLLIAPESGRGLYGMAAGMESIGANLLGPTPEFIGWATNKHQTAETFRRAGVPAPRGTALIDGGPWPADFPTPAVLKPIDGCGSQNVRRIDGPCGDSRPPSWPDERSDEVEPAWRLEEFIPGTAASVAVLRGSEEYCLLPSCAQHLADDRTFTYLGGACPLQPSLAERARNLAERAIKAMPPGRGYVGIDLVLGAADDGSRDYVIEVNPRLTTSYIGLRALADTNLAAAMIDVVEGRTPELRFRPGRVEFTAEGRVSLS